MVIRALHSAAQAQRLQICSDKISSIALSLAYLSKFRATDKPSTAY